MDSTWFIIAKALSSYWGFFSSEGSRGGPKRDGGFINAVCVTRGFEIKHTISNGGNRAKAYQILPLYKILRRLDGEKGLKSFHLFSMNFEAICKKHTSLVR